MTGGRRRAFRRGHPGCCAVDGKAAGGRAGRHGSAGSSGHRRAIRSSGHGSAVRGIGHGSAVGRSGHHIAICRRPRRDTITALAGGGAR